ncbi:hypothetical protein JG687_00017374 [Phytophthora cactorum]|uniref:Uncharacterized protein n=1 Tax=Phytophthora cactorum TaxID=29920 RepID=A0A329SDQ3_9STRA|nr:hypothetical protein Pcac1_g10035 [Phytophthora cactorum]KAG2798579.1 hypothetical protein PC112_g21288 [Phytophthora cactorum]KAG2798890.1 hypothetical protein PC111_g20659 [Phytophthora cactorum]KAG2831030.1 hypothetical protein PC113_g21002 [Phytophthora cactorum]KAG2877583.1 hypothetical protein PC114_g23547 [Phytophthora cactorum]
MLANLDGPLTASTTTSTEAVEAATPTTPPRYCLVMSNSRFYANSSSTKNAKI